MATLTAKETVIESVTGTQLTSGIVPVFSEDSLYVLVSYKADATPQKCFYGARRLRRVGQRYDAVNGFGFTLFNLRMNYDDDSQSIDVTWAADAGARVMAIYTLDQMHINDQISRNLSASNANAHTGYTPTEHIRSDEFALGALVSNGPVTDTALTVDATSPWVQAERIGTSLPTDTDNITMQVAYQQLTTSGVYRFRGTGATTRNWCSVISTFRPVENQATDYFGSLIVVGDKVQYFADSTNYTVLGIPFARNVVDIGAPHGVVPAISVEVRE